MDSEHRNFLLVAVSVAIFVAGLVLIPDRGAGGNFGSPKIVRTPNNKYMSTLHSFIEAHQVGEEDGIEIVEPPAGADVYIVASRFFWRPNLILTEGETYTLHLYSSDALHGFQIPDMGIRYEVAPGFELTTKFTPDKSGEFTILCDEFCGDGHHLMTSRLAVQERDIK